MRAVSSTYKQIIASGETRKYVVRIDLNLANNTSLTITDADIMENSFKVLTASSGQSSLDIGSAIIGKCQFTLDNFTDRWTQYDFFDATATVWVGLVGDLDNGTQIYHRLGFFTVDEPNIAGSLISLEMLDNMWKFDRDLPNIPLSQTVGSIVNLLCTHCGVTLASQVFNGSDYWVQYLPTDEMNCRELLQYLAMIGCNFCVMDGQGALKIRWYDTSSRPSDTLDGGTFSTSTTPYSDGDTADGGNFTNYTSGADYDGGSFTDNPNIAYFTRLFDRKIGTDSITVTGVKIKIGEQDYLMGTEGYVLVIENPLVTEDNVSAILSRIWNRLQGFTFRTYDVTTLPDIAPEVGDCVGVSYKGTIVYSYLTNNTFTPSLTTASLGAVTPTRALSQRYSKAVQTAVEVARQQVDKQIGFYDVAAQRMNQLAINAMGAYTDFEDAGTGGRIYYMSDSPITKNETTGICSFPDSAVVYKTTGDGFFISRSGDVDPTTHARIWTEGYTPSTGLLVQLLTALRINAKQLYTGQLTVGGSQTGVTKPFVVVLDTDDDPICYLDYRGITMYQGLIQDPNYVDDPNSVFAQSGMSIDVNNAVMKSEYFAINALGAFLKGTIEATGGHIGAATIDSTSIKVIGDYQIYKGTGTFKFRPIDYAITETFKIACKVESGSSTVTVKKHTASGETTVETISVSGVARYISHDLSALDPSDEEEYYNITVSGSSTSIELYKTTLAYMGTEGFKGVLEGIFRGHIDATGNFKGHVEAENGSKFGNYEVNNSDITNSSMLFNPSEFTHYNDSKVVEWDSNGMVTVSKQSSGSFGHIYTIDNSYDPTEDGYSDAESAVPRLRLYLNKESGGNSSVQINKTDSSGTANVVWSDTTNYLRWEDIQIVTTDIGEGQPMNGKWFVLVVDP